MKITALQVSNVLSFKYFNDVMDAPKLSFDAYLNIIIGENGAGKSTALEVLNFIFRRVLFTQFSVNQDLYFKRSSLDATQSKEILSPVKNNSYGGFRLDPNWNAEEQAQRIRLCIELDEIDEQNIKNLLDNKDKLDGIVGRYSKHSSTLAPLKGKNYEILVALEKNNRSFTVQISPDQSDPGYQYLVNYNFFKELINFYNIEHPDVPIPPLYESFSLIGGYRNYNAFNPAVSLQTAHAAHQIQQIKSKEYSRSLTTSEESEPAVFNLVRLRVAERHFELFGTKCDKDECEEKANKLPFLTSINKSLQLVNLKCKIRLIDQRNWQYSFEFFDTNRNKILSDINSLSAGQKAIVHLVFEAYGRGELKGGLVVIDEPEIHLHYQFQNEYLRVIEEINDVQNCQYVLVTHSESLVNSSTIHHVKRFALDEDNNTQVKAPTLTTDQRYLVKILDNTRSTYAFFGKKVLLVEGETDRYFYKELIHKIDPKLTQEIAVLDIQGKPNYTIWKEFFEKFGLNVYFISDLDAAFNFFYPNETPYKLHSPEIVAGFKCTHRDLEVKIEEKYGENVYILKNGGLEHYIGIHQKGLPATIEFCTESLSDFLKNSEDPNSQEIQSIINMVITH